MKKFVYFLILLGVFYAPTIQAQNADTIKKKVATVSENEEYESNNEGIPKNFLKVNMTSILLGNVSLQYERALTPRVSAAIGLRWMPEQRLPLKNFTLNMVDRYVGLDSNTAEIEEILNNVRLKGMVVTPELRFYFRKHQRGLYLGLIGRIEQYNGEYNNFELVVDGNTQYAKLQGKYQSLGAGILLGSQFRLSKSIYLDWWIVGPYITQSKLRLDVSGYTISEDDYREVEEQLQDVSLDNDYFTTSIMVGRTSSNVTMKGNLMGIRALGLCLSFRF